MWDWCRNVSGIDGYLARPHTVLVFCQHAVYPDIHSGPQPEQVPRYPYKPGWLSDHIGLLSLGPRHGPA